MTIKKIHEENYEPTTSARTNSKFQIEDGQLLQMSLYYNSGKYWASFIPVRIRVEGNFNVTTSNPMAGAREVLFKVSKGSKKHEQEALRIFNERKAMYLSLFGLGDELIQTQ